MITLLRPRHFESNERFKVMPLSESHSDNVAMATNTKAKVGGLSIFFFQKKKQKALFRFAEDQVKPKIWQSRSQGCTLDGPMTMLHDNE
jgi:hypothetical protein